MPKLSATQIMYQHRKELKKIYDESGCNVRRTWEAAQERIPPLSGISSSQFKPNMAMLLAYETDTGEEEQAVNITATEAENHLLTNEEQLNAPTLHYLAFWSYHLTYYMPAVQPDYTVPLWGSTLILLFGIAVSLMLLIIGYLKSPR